MEFIDKPVLWFCRVMLLAGLFCFVWSYFHDNFVADSLQNTIITLVGPAILLVDYLGNKLQGHK